MFGGILQTRMLVSTNRLVIFFNMNFVHANKYNKKLQSPGALNIKETPGYKQKENVKKC